MKAITDRQCTEIADAFDRRRDLAPGEVAGKDLAKPWREPDFP